MSREGGSDPQIRRRRPQKHHCPLVVAFVRPPHVADMTPQPPQINLNNLTVSLRFRARFRYQTLNLLFISHHKLFRSTKNTRMISYSNRSSCLAASPPWSPGRYSIDIGCQTSIQNRKNTKLAFKIVKTQN